MSRPYELSLILPDPHLPHESKPTIAAIEQYAADEHWDNWLCLGDLLDNEAISSFNAGKPRKVSNAPTVKYQFEYANAFLDRHLAAVRHKNPRCKLIYLEGNHEERTERYVDRSPELEGLVDVEHALRLKERGVQYVRSWSRGELYALGKLRFSHGRFATKNHAAKHVQDFGCSIGYGHVHDIQTFSVKQLGKLETLAAMSFGCTCDYQQPYLQGAPTNWQHAIGVVWTFPDGLFQAMAVPIFNGRFIGPTTGKVYQAKAVKRGR